MQGEAFRKLQKKAKRLDAKSLDYSKRIRQGIYRDIRKREKESTKYKEAINMRIISRTKVMKDGRNILKERKLSRI